MVNTVCLNAGAGLYVYGIAPSIIEGYKIAKDKVKSGEVIQTLNKWSESTKKRKQ